MAEPAEKRVQIVNKRGLHARAAAKFVRLVEHHNADVKVRKDDMEVCGTSIMGLLMLSAGMNSVITIAVKGEKATGILQELIALVERRFDEEG
jgi:phosphocarrier protein